MFCKVLQCTFFKHLCFFDAKESKEWSLMSWREADLSHLIPLASLHCRKPASLCTKSQVWQSRRHRLKAPSGPRSQIPSHSFHGPCTGLAQWQKLLACPPWRKEAKGKRNDCDDLSWQAELATSSHSRTWPTCSSTSHLSRPSNRMSDATQRIRNEHKSS